MSMSKVLVERAQACYRSFQRDGVVCSGCQFDGVCGMGKREAVTLAGFLATIDPTGQNVKAIYVGPIEAQEVQDVGDQE